MPRYKNGLARVGKVFHYCFKIKSVQFKGSTYATDRATAESVLATKRREALLGPQEIALPMPSMKMLVESWVKSYATTYSSKHLESVQGFAKVWINPEMGEVLVDRVSTQRVLDLRRKVLDSGRSPATANLLLRIIKLLLSHAVRLGHIKERPFKVSPLRFQKKPRPVIPATSMAKFLEAAAKGSRNPQVGVMLTTMVGLGLRESELLGMRWDWINLDQFTYQVGKAKNKESRIIPIPGWVWTRLMTMPRNLNTWVFHNQEGKPYKKGLLRIPLERVCQSLNLRNIHMHRLRATFASLHAEAGTPITEIKDLLGHKNIQTTMIYVETSLESKRHSQDALGMKLGLL